MNSLFDDPIYQKSGRKKIVPRPDDERTFISGVDERKKKKKKERTKKLASTREAREEEREREGT